MSEARPAPRRETADVTGEDSRAPLRVRRAVGADAAAVAEIYNQGIVARTATFDTDLRTEADRRAVIESGDERHPVLVAELDGRVVGWASIAAYRPRACYRGVGEASLYVEAAHRGKGVGRRLMETLIDEARRLGYWKVLSRLFPGNAASRGMCRAAGFREVGVYEKHAQLDGRWRDVIIVERLIPENQTSNA
jgi:L-amino acid N-acyltransferase YncA